MEVAKSVVEERSTRDSCRTNPVGRPAVTVNCAGCADLNLFRLRSVEVQVVDSSSSSR